MNVKNARRGNYKARDSYTSITYEDMPKKWLVWNERVWRLVVMGVGEFDRMVQSFVTNAHQASTLLAGIDRMSWDMQSKFYVVNELVLMGKLKLYNSEQEARAALEGVAA